MPNNWIGHYKCENSDKVYIVSIQNDFGSYSVFAKYNRYRAGCKLIVEKKGTWGTAIEAQSEASKLIFAKEKKGYKNIDSSDYAGPLNRDEFKQYLAIEDSSFSEMVPDKKGIFEVLCVSNFGYEEQFDIGVSYLARIVKNEPYFSVEDKFGKWNTCDKNRFKVGAES